MNDDLTPPPDQLLDDATRARIRERVVAGLDDRAPRRAWLVPIAAAAAVVVLAGVTGYVALRPDDPGADPAPGVPADQGTDQPSSAPTPENGDGSVVSEMPGEGVTTSPLPEDYPTETPADSSCAQEVPGVLRGADEVLVVPVDGGTSTTFYVAGDRWTLCHDHGGRATVHRPQPFDDSDSLDAYDVSSLFTVDGVETYSAGGPVPDGLPDFALTYAFPDGHDEQATITTDSSGRRWWSMVYVSPDGVPTNRPIRVERVNEYDDREVIPLEWGIDTCAQANHGC